MRDRERNSYEGGKNIHVRRETQEGDNIVASQYPSRRAWREMKNNGVGH